MEPPKTRGSRGILVYKQDWGAAQETFSRWWDGRNEEPVLAVCAPTRHPRVAWDAWGFMKAPGRIRDVIRDFERSCEATSFLGDAFPALFPQTGAVALAPFYTGYCRFYENTAWFECGKEWDEVRNLSRNPESDWALFNREIVETSLDLGAGKWITGMPDFSSPTDILAAIRGTQNLLLDFAERPGDVAETTARITRDLVATEREFASLITRVQRGWSTWMPIWCGAHYLPLQCDFSPMISPRMFDELSLPSLAELARALERSIYHMDGPGEFRHLDSLLSLPDLDAIQWTPGAGNPGLEDPCWFPLYRRILESGKGLALLGVPFPCIDAVCDAVGTRGLFISAAAPSADEGRALLRKWKKSGGYDL